MSQRIQLNLLERRLKALSGMSRLKLLKEIKKRRSANVSTLAKAVGLSLETTSIHLQRLARLDIIKGAKRGTKVFYRLSLHQEPPIKHIVQLL